MSLSMMARRVRRISACSGVNCTVTSYLAGPRAWGPAVRQETSAVAQPGQGAHQLGNDLQHDLVGAAADRAETAVAVAACHGTVPQVARAAPILQAGL